MHDNKGIDMRQNMTVTNVYVTVTDIFAILQSFTLFSTIPAVANQYFVKNLLFSQCLFALHLLEKKNKE